MRIILPILAAALLLRTCCEGEAGEQQFARSMSGQFSIVSEQGWPGRRYVEGGVVFAEEFDSNRDGKIDVWRFYRRGVLSSEEQDLNHDGRVDLVTTWNPGDPRVQRLTGMSRDTGHRGFNDLEMENTGRNRWRIQEDRNGDGVADRILEADGPYQFFEELALNLDAHPDVIDYVPMEYWVEYQSDDGFLRFISDYRRYSRGRQTYYGQWDGRRVNWLRYDPNNPPPPPQTVPAMRTQPLSPSPSTPPPASGDAAYVGQPYADDGTYVAPSDPYAGAQSPYPDVSDPFAAPDASTGYYYDSTFVDQSPPPPRSDRTRYEGMPPGDSAARSLPARMRPPGVGRR